MSGKNLIREIYLNGAWVSYELARKNIKNLYLRVSAEGTIKVSAPKRLSLAEIEQFIAKNEAFIARSQEKTTAKINLNADFFSQKWLPFLGERLEIAEITAAESRIWRDGARLFIAGADEKTRISLFYKWLDGETKSALNDSLARIYPLFMPLGVEYPELALRKMRARWGSCAVNEGKITLNKRLIHVPQECIDYVSAHELAHFLEPNHSANFYRMLDNVRPSWRMEREKLAQYTCQK